MSSLCYLRGLEGSCWPLIDRAHWIPKRTLKAAFIHGAMQNSRTGRIAPCGRFEQFAGGGDEWLPVPLGEVIWDPRITSPLCRWHHAQMDNARLRVPRGLVPVSAIDFCEEYGLLWAFDRLYPIEVEEAA